MNKMKIYVFGNSLVKEDSGALQTMPTLQVQFPQIQFVAVDPNENFPPENEKNITILDTVSGIYSVMFFDFTDLKNVEKTPISPHDYDLLLHLLLLKKMGKIDSVKIIGLPMKIITHKEMKEIKRIISSLL